MIGFLSGLIATITAIGTILWGKSILNKPCYLSMFEDNAKNISNFYNSVINCCGEYQKISLLNQNCTEPDLNYYKKGIF